MGPSTRGAAPMSEATSRRVSRILSSIGVALALYYLFMGGEYALFDVRELEAARADRVARIDSLRTVLDSVEAWADSLESSPRVIERVAREKHGFIRPGELLVRFVNDDELEDGTGSGG